MKCYVVTFKPQWNIQCQNSCVTSTLSSSYSILWDELFCVVSVSLASSTRVPGAIRQRLVPEKYHLKGMDLIKIKRVSVLIFPRIKSVCTVAWAKTSKRPHRMY